VNDDIRIEGGEVSQLPNVVARDSLMETEMNTPLK
jgi:hypothetical protein